MIAHVGPVPLEEMLPLVPGAGAFLVLARGWLMLRLRRRTAGAIVGPPGAERVGRERVAPAGVLDVLGRPRSSS